MWILNQIWEIIGFFLSIIFTLAVILFIGVVIYYYWYIAIPVIVVTGIYLTVEENRLENEERDKEKDK